MRTDASQLVVLPTGQKVARVFSFRLRLIYLKSTIALFIYFGDKIEKLSCRDLAHTCGVIFKPTKVNWVFS